MEIFPAQAGSLSAGEISTFHCQSGGSRPPARLAWFDYQGTKIKDATSEVSQETLREMWGDVGRWQLAKLYNQIETKNAGKECLILSDTVDMSSNSSQVVPLHSTADLCRYQNFLHYQIPASLLPWNHLPPGFSACLIQLFNVKLVTYKTLHLTMTWEPVLLIWQFLPSCLALMVL